MLQYLKVKSACFVDKCMGLLITGSVMPMVKGLQRIVNFYGVNLIR